MYKSSEFQFGVAIRESGNVDFYWNSTRVDSPTEKFIDVDINFDYIYLTRADGS
jgi:hypothetical protein